MKTYIQNYHDEYYVFKLAKAQETHVLYMQKGFNHIYRDNGIYKLYTYDGYIVMDDSVAALFEAYSEDDVLSIDNHGIVYEQYLLSSDDNALLCTLQCNSNCVMCPCSEQSRKHAWLRSLADLKETLKYIPRNAPHLTVTGGEPSLLRDDFFGLMSCLRYDFDTTRFLLLTNGRAFGDINFTKKFVECMPENILIGIPLYGYSPKTHDCITRAKGSFVQAATGIHNLLQYGIEVEIRIVLTKQNISNMEKTAKYIASNFNKVAYVNFMGLELMGNAAKNREVVWLPYDEAFQKSKKAIRLLVETGINVQLYNFPLCSVDSEYWDICKKSISGYKVEYSDECNTCDLKEICGGVFKSTRRITKFKGHPIKR